MGLKTHKSGPEKNLVRSCDQFESILENFPGAWNQKIVTFNDNFTSPQFPIAGIHPMFSVGLDRILGKYQSKEDAQEKADLQAATGSDRLWGS